MNSKDFMQRECLVSQNNSTEIPVSYDSGRFFAWVRSITFPFSDSEINRFSGKLPDARRTWMLFRTLLFTRELS
jgi:hypothetical protein